MSEQKRDLIDALASEQRTTRDCMPEAVHRGQGASRNRQRLTGFIALMKNGIRRIAAVVPGVTLCLPERTSDVELPEGGAGSRSKDKVVWLRESRCQLVTDRMRASSRGIGTVRAEPSVLTG